MVKFVERLDLDTIVLVLIECLLFKSYETENI